VGPSGIALYDDLTDRSAIERQLAVNLKAAAFSLTQSLRALLAGRGVSVHAVLTGTVDTDMSRGLEIPKPSAESVARAIFDGVEKDEEDIFPDPMSSSLAEGWRGGVVKEFERQCVAMTAAVPAGS
jgi:NAD(P)-dependent dehydrogenase (short-subunit alcohol dehydrogenase family)